MRIELCVPWLRQEVETTLRPRDFWQLGAGMVLAVACLVRDNIWGAVAGVALVRELFAHCVVYPGKRIPSVEPSPTSPESTSALREPSVLGGNGEGTRCDPSQDLHPRDTREVTNVCRGEPEEVFLSPYWCAVLWNAKEHNDIWVHVRRATFYQNRTQEHQTLVKVVKKRHISHEDLWEALISVRAAIHPARIAVEEFWETSGRTRSFHPRSTLAPRSIIWRTVPTRRTSTI